MVPRVRPVLLKLYFMCNDYSYFNKTVRDCLDTRADRPERVALNFG